MSHQSQRGFTAYELFVVLLSAAVLAGIGGWIANIVKLSGMEFASVTGMLVLRAIGVFIPPLGAVLGFI